MCEWPSTMYRLGTGENLLQGTSYRLRALAVRGEERLARAEAERAGHARGHGAGQLERVGRARAEQPERGRDAAQEPVVLDQRGSSVGGERAGPAQRAQRRGSRGPADGRVA